MSQVGIPYICKFLAHHRGLLSSMSQVVGLVLFELNTLYKCFFIFQGGCNLVWVVAWFLLVWDSPAEHPHISKEEKVTLSSLSYIDFCPYTI